MISGYQGYQDHLGQFQPPPPEYSINDNVYVRRSATRRIVVSFAEIYQASQSNSITHVILTHITSKIEGKCTVEGYIQPGSTVIQKHSCGVVNGPNVMFDVDFYCNVCCPQEGEFIRCVAKTITQAGIRAVIRFTGSDTVLPSPVEIYVARDMHKNCNYFNTIHEGDAIVIKVIGQRFVLNDPHVSIIGQLVEEVHAVPPISTPIKTQPPPPQPQPQPPQPPIPSTQETHALLPSSTNATATATTSTKLKIRVKMCKKDEDHSTQHKKQ